MKNIIKALNYQTRRDYIVILLLLSGLVQPVVSLCQMILNEINMSAGMFFGRSAETYCFTTIVIFVIIVPRICGWDAADKTINYEIMAGHSRSEVYFGRVIVSLVWSLTEAVAMLVLPLLAVSVFFGWGKNMNAADAAIRCILVIFPLFRFVCEFILLTFLLKNCYMAMIVGWLLFDAAMIANMCYQEFTDRAFTFQFAFSNLLQVLDFGNYKFEYIGGKDIPVYVTAVSPSMAAGTICSSLLVGIVCIAIGHVVFCRQDMG